MLVCPSGPLPYGYAILSHIVDSQLFLLPQDVPYSNNGTDDNQAATDICRLLITERQDRLWYIQRHRLYLKS